MKNLFKLTPNLLLIILVILISIFSIMYITKNKNPNTSSVSATQDYKNKLLVIGTSADYPPFEFKQGEEFKGLDIDLAKLFAKELKAKIKFKDLAYNNLFAALNAGQIDLVISSITSTKERELNFDLSNPYYFADLAIIFRRDAPIQDVAELHHKKVGAQLGTTMELWVKEMFHKAHLTAMDLNTQLIESLKSKQLDVIVIEYAQAKEFCKHDKDLGYLVASKSNHGYVVVMKKHSKLLQPINTALERIKQQGHLDILEKQWLELIVETELHDAN